MDQLAPLSSSQPASSKTILSVANLFQQDHLVLPNKNSLGQADQTRVLSTNEIKWVTITGDQMVD
jgi:hypothetical protein